MKLSLSIRTTLMLLLALTLLLAILINSALGHLLVQHEVNEVFDAELAVNAKLIKGLLSDEDLEEDLPRIARVMSESLGLPPADQPELEAYERSRLIQIWKQDGSGLLFRSPGAPQHALAPLKKGFYHHKGPRSEWMVYVTDLPGHNAWLMVGEYPHARNDIIRELGSIFGITGVFALILCSLIAMAAIEYGLNPLRQLGSVLRRRSVDNLQSVTLKRTPRELQPVVSGLNDMFSRLHAGLDRERHFVADAAHELRTPLAVIKLQTQHLQNLQGDDLRQGLEHLELGSDRASQLVEKLLLLARMDDRDEDASRQEPQDIAELCRRTLAALQWQADQAVITLSLDAPEDLPPLAIDPSLVEIALRNLIDNAICYGGQGQEVETRLYQENGHLCLCVRDHGNGVSDDDLKRITERFYRAGRGGDNGTGLGLSIVSRVMESLHGEMRVRNHPHGGLEVTLLIPQHTARISRG